MLYSDVLKGDEDLKAPRRQYACCVMPVVNTSGEPVTIQAGTVMATASPWEDNEEDVRRIRHVGPEKKIGVQKKKLCSEGTRGDVVIRDVTGRDVELRGLRAGVNRAQLEASCSRHRSDRVTKGKKAKMRFPTFEESGSKRKEKKRSCQKAISPSDKKTIPHKKEPRKFVVEEDHQ
jgi:hypothetical protein